MSPDDAGALPLPNRPIQCGSLPPAPLTRACSHQDALLIAHMAPLHRGPPESTHVSLFAHVLHTYTPNKHSQLSQLKLWPPPAYCTPCLYSTMPCRRAARLLHTCMLVQQRHVLPALSFLSRVPRAVCTLAFLSSLPCSNVFLYGCAIVPNRSRCRGRQSKAWYSGRVWGSSRAQTAEPDWVTCSCAHSWRLYTDRITRFIAGNGRGAAKRWEATTRQPYSGGPPSAKAYGLPGGTQCTAASAANAEPSVYSTAALSNSTHPTTLPPACPGSMASPNVATPSSPVDASSSTRCPASSSGGG